MTQRGKHALNLIRDAGSTSRYLNILRSHQKVAERAERDEWMFRNRLLCRAIVCKVSLPMRDAMMLKPPKRYATKVILPLNAQDMTLGGKYFLMGQSGYDQVAREIWGDAAEEREHDELVLGMLAAAPTLDPFVLREYLRSAGLNLHPDYFDLAEEDVRRIYDFVRDEFSALVRIAFGAQADVGEFAPRLAEKVLLKPDGPGSEELRRTLMLEPDEYREGIFCWKGFLYFKWLLERLRLGLPEHLDGIRKVMVRGTGTTEQADYIARQREAIPQGLARVGAEIAMIIKRYDAAYAGLTQREDAAGFRTFLLAAPRLFADLGERVGVIEHICAVWDMQFRPGIPPAAPAGELADLFYEFEQTLTGFLQSRAAA
ncbi:MAG: hypothetical protein KIS81_05530 [Maricaulaceae bacterium]|nr:hypothetical protein [Maricaulaceae bacterium]